MHQQTRTIEINASANKCFQVICDFQAYPQWQRTMKKVEVVSQENGRPTVITYFLDAVLKTISYTLRYTYDENDAKNLKLKWSYVRGDLKNIQGSYLFAEIAGNKTHVTFDLAIDIGMWVPGIVLNRFKEASMQETLDNLKRRVESLKQ
jgi:uncharacterized membrane protein